MFGRTSTPPTYTFADSKLLEYLYDVYHCCVFSEKLLMMDRGTVRNMYRFIPKINLEKLVHLVGFIMRIINIIKCSVFSYPKITAAGKRTVTLCICA